MRGKASGPGRRSTAGRSSFRPFSKGLLAGSVLGGLLTWWIFCEPCPAPTPCGEAPIPASVMVTKVVDGDTFVIQGNRAVRVLGIDTPERGKPYFQEATNFLAKKIDGRRVEIVPCEAAREDRYGRLLAFVHTGGSDPGLELLRQGLARTLLIPPCSREVPSTYGIAEREAFREGLGIWSLDKTRQVGHADAHQYMGRMMTVTGRVKSVHEGRKVVYMNFGEKLPDRFHGCHFPGGAPPARP